MRKLSRILFRNAVCIFVLLVFAIASLFFYLLHLSSRNTVHTAALRSQLPQPDSIPVPNYHSVLHNDSECLYRSAYYKPFYKPLESFQKVRLVFYKKHKMTAVANVARGRGWVAMSAIKSLTKLLSFIMDDTFTIIFTSSKELSDIAFHRYANNSNVLAAGIPGAYRFTGTKREQYITYQKYLNRFGCSIESIKMMPSLYLLDNDLQCKSFFKRLDSEGSGSTERMWVLKNSRGFGGDQVEVIHNTTSLRVRFGGCQGNEQFIAQEYIQNLLLLNKRKFDIRALVLIANTQPLMLFYHEGYLRVVIREFDPFATREVHLTNTHVQSLQPGFLPDNHFWSFGKFQSYLDGNIPDNDDFVRNKLIPYIKRIATLIVKSGEIGFANWNEPINRVIVSLMKSTRI